jgi:hypothetical protein
MRGRCRNIFVFFMLLEYKTYANSNKKGKTFFEEATFDFTEKNKTVGFTTKESDDASGVWKFNR